MLPAQDIEKQRENILEQMRQIRGMERGSITEQFLKTKRKGNEAETLCGPYYVFSKRADGKTVSRRIKPGEELEQTKRDVEQYKRFAELCKKFEELTEQLGKLERGTIAKKKRRRSPSSKTTKSNIS